MNQNEDLSDENNKKEFIQIFKNRTIVCRSISDHESEDEYSGKGLTLIEGAKNYLRRMADLSDEDEVKIHQDIFTSQIFEKAEDPIPFNKEELDAFEGINRNPSNVNDQPSPDAVTKSILQLLHYETPDLQLFESFIPSFKALISKSEDLRVHPMIFNSSSFSKVKKTPAKNIYQNRPLECLSIT
ncbi:MAG: hypothetical protein HWD61_01165 [Parachlamydiaceae bacterium]|nr:MAG: hypothetical protein HWD61_01165 [Parachlamydiaceae bacterium]